MDIQLLREERKKAGYTQSDMAKKLGYAGKSGYSMLENGQVEMTIGMSLKLKEILNLSDEKYQEIFFPQLHDARKQAIQYKTHEEELESAINILTGLLHYHQRMRIVSRLSLMEDIYEKALLTALKCLRSECQKE